ncbi:hypothetical protein H6F50_25285 [Coleofasciculus sp. FACHB-712]|uniref:hypothetical protein n=1 Tax=Cyanophyceae TaxID=3028117 RepID=UPI0016838D9E|nr:hypothetical protein [Coleofasciculus sp. FACHB-712]MBD1945625.1 hypothetical protein [Coleofasciculus sp. FACHB-712]
MTQLNGAYIGYPGCHVHDLISPDDFDSELNIPHVEEIIKFGRSIGISKITIKPGYEQWWNILHEIGHFAVKPDSYIQMWRSHGAPDGIPNLNWFAGQNVIKPEDPTPDEWGVRAWCLSVLELKGWLNPLQCIDWPVANDWEGRGRNNPHLWMKSEITSRCHPLYKNGFRQLAAIGIDFNRGILRPTKEIVTVGWQPVFRWQVAESTEDISF